jgi:hypothetical protein
MVTDLESKRKKERKVVQRRVTLRKSQKRLIIGIDEVDNNTLICQQQRVTSLYFCSFMATTNKTLSCAANIY